MKEYDLYVPLAYNDGRPIEGRKLARLRERLLAVFGGLTFLSSAESRILDVRWSDLSR